VSRDASSTYSGSDAVGEWTCEDGIAIEQASPVRVRSWNTFLGCMVMEMPRTELVIFLIKSRESVDILLKIVWMYFAECK
jgi:hypothetical protein